MNVFRTVRIASVVVVVAAASLAAQSGAQQTPPMPKPGPEHAVFQLDAGTWDAAVEMSAGPGVPWDPLSRATAS
jgi:hypothetical protein